MHHTASPVAQGRAAWLALGGTGGPAAGPLTTGSRRRSFPSTPLIVLLQFSVLCPLDTNRAKIKDNP